MKKIIVIGDACVDEFIYCNCNRLCPEAPVPLLDIDHATKNGGMAANVGENIRSLTTPETYDITMLTNANWPSVKKTRFVDNKTNHMFLRIDSTVKTEKINMDNFDASLYDAIIISDYNKGFLSNDNLKTIIDSHPLVFIDTKRKLGEWVKNAAFIKINHHEYANSINEIKSNNLEDKIICTRGGDGCVYKNITYSVNKVGVIDVSGAGDTFLAALTVNYLDGSSIENAIIFANTCASKVVQERGVSVIKLTK